MALSQPPAWASMYVGLPYVDRGRDRAGCDCYGLLRLILREQANIELPACTTQAYGNGAEWRAIAAELGQARQSGDWLQVARNLERPLDAVALLSPVRVGDGWGYAPIHVGVVVGGGWLVHVERATASVLVRYREAMPERVESFWRHRSLQSE